MNERLFNLIESGNLNVTPDLKWVLEALCEEVLNTSDLEYAVLTAENELFKTRFKEAFLALEINSDMLDVLNAEFGELAA